jgi:hypothetical protein
VATHASAAGPPVDGRALTRIINANTILDILDSGCSPPVDVNVVKNDNVRHLACSPLATGSIRSS